MVKVMVNKRKRPLTGELDEPEMRMNWYTLLIAIVRNCSPEIARMKMQGQMQPTKRGGRKPIYTPEEITKQRNKDARQGMKSRMVKLRIAESAGDPVAIQKLAALKAYHDKYNEKRRKASHE